MLSGNRAQIFSMHLDQLSIDMSRPVFKNLTTCPALYILYDHEFLCGCALKMIIYSFSYFVNTPLYSIFADCPSFSIFASGGW